MSQHRYCDLAVECVETGDHHTAATIAIPLDALADFEGAADTPVVIEAVAPDRTIVRWEDRGIPQSREYNLITPDDRLEPMPASPATWASNPAGLLDALAEAAKTSTPDSNRYALECIQLQGNRGQVVATDGRQLLVRSGYSLPWTEELLIKARPIFACRALPRDQPVEVGRTDTHVFVRVGPWTISSAIQADLRFPAVDRLIPAAGEIGTGCGWTPPTRGSSNQGLDRLTGDHEINSPVTMDLNGKVAGARPPRTSPTTSPSWCYPGRRTAARRSASSSTGTCWGGRDDWATRSWASRASTRPSYAGTRPDLRGSASGLRFTARGGRRGNPHRVGSDRRPRGPRRVAPETTRRTTTVRSRGMATSRSSDRTATTRSPGRPRP